MNTLIPLALVVTMEIIKAIQAIFIAWDVDMYDPVQGLGMKVTSMTLHEELGYINYIFSDKTGTLTQNNMLFKACSIATVCYDEDYLTEDYEFEPNLKGKLDNSLDFFPSDDFRPEMKRRLTSIASITYETS